MVTKDNEPYGAIKKLWAAVLLQTDHDIRKCRKGKAKRHRDDALAWINSSYWTAQDRGCFLWVCDLLGLDPVKARRVILRRGMRPGGNKIVKKRLTVS